MTYLHLQPSPVSIYAPGEIFISRSFSGEPPLSGPLENLPSPSQPRSIPSPRGTPPPPRTPAPRAWELRPPWGPWKGADPSQDNEHLSPSPSLQGAPATPRGAGLGGGERLVAKYPKAGDTFPDVSTQALGRTLILEAWRREGRSLGFQSWRGHICDLRLLTFQRPYSPPLPLRAQPCPGGGPVCVHSVFGGGGRGRVHVLGNGGDRLSF